MISMSFQNIYFTTDSSLKRIEVLGDLSFWRLLNFLNGKILFVKQLSLTFSRPARTWIWQKYRVLVTNSLITYLNWIFEKQEQISWSQLSRSNHMSVQPFQLSFESLKSYRTESYQHLTVLESFRLVFE